MLTPIETQYAGCRFRSRLEARWAVVFDVLGWKWTYEPEGFWLPSGRPYLPDFLIESIGYIEIKPSLEHDDGKLVEFGQVSDREAYLIVGEVPGPADVNELGSLCPRAASGVEIYHAEDWTPEYWFAICPRCRFIGITYQARYPRLNCGCFREQEKQGDDRHWNNDISWLRIALTAARSERFGERR